jgi:hypothetical protein
MNEDKDRKQFFKLFQEPTFEGSRAAAGKMRKIAKRQIKHNQEFMLFYSLHHLIRSDKKKLRWPSSPLLVLLQLVDPNVLSGDEDAILAERDTRATPLQELANLLDTVDYSTHEDQLILAKQLIEHGANVNAVSSPQRKTPLHNACDAGNVTNLDFVEFLLKEGADPNAQDDLGLTPLMCTTPSAPGVAKFLLNWSTTNVNTTSRCGASFLTRARSTIADLSSQLSIPDNRNQVRYEFLLHQWRDIEEMSVEMGP